MAATLHAGGTPDVGPFNSSKTKLQQACALTIMRRPDGRLRRVRMGSLLV